MMLIGIKASRYAESDTWLRASCHEAFRHRYAGVPAIVLVGDCPARPKTPSGFRSLRRLVRSRFAERPIAPVGAGLF